jgi:hypothetical protein
VVSSGITVRPNFVKLGELIPMLRGGTHIIMIHSVSSIYNDLSYSVSCCCVWKLLWKVRTSDGLQWHDVHRKLSEKLPLFQEEDIHSFTHTHTHTHAHTDMDMIS